MVRNLIVEIELAEPAVSKMQRHFLTQPALMTNAIAITDQKYPDHQLDLKSTSHGILLYRDSTSLSSTRSLTNSDTGRMNVQRWRYRSASRSEAFLVR